MSNDAVGHDQTSDPAMSPSDNDERSSNNVTSPNNNGAALVYSSSNALSGERTTDAIPTRFEFDFTVIKEWYCKLKRLDEEKTKIPIVLSIPVDKKRSYKVR